jgi:hypothetical protein
MTIVIEQRIRAWESGHCASLSRRFRLFTISAIHSHLISSLTQYPSPSPMSSLKLHSSLHTPVVHAGASLQAKSSVLTGVQDAYWSDEEVRSLCLFSKKNCAHIPPFLTNSIPSLLSYGFAFVGSEGVSPLPRGNGYLGFELQAVPVRVPGTHFLFLSLLQPFECYYHANRFADFVGITFEETSTISVPRAGGITPTKLANSSLSIKKSVWFSCI